MHREIEEKLWNVSGLKEKERYAIKERERERESVCVCWGKGGKMNHTV